MLLCLVYLVFMGLPSAGAVVPLEAVPGFFRACLLYTSSRT